jgi:hypothetical protein
MFANFGEAVWFPLDKRLDPTYPGSEGSVVDITPAGFSSLASQKRSSPSPAHAPRVQRSVLQECYVKLAPNNPESSSSILMGMCYRMLQRWPLSIASPAAQLQQLLVVGQTGQNACKAGER